MIEPINYDDVVRAEWGTNEYKLQMRLITIQIWASKIQTIVPSNVTIAKEIDKFVREVLVFRPKESAVVAAVLSPGQQVASLIIPPPDGSAVANSVQPTPGPLQAVSDLSADEWSADEFVSHDSNGGA